MHDVFFHARSEADTERLGAALADLLPGGAVVALIGTLGAGKTRLVRAVASACNVPDGVVVSPTFVLIGQYQGRRTIYHFDVYRLRSDAEFAQLGSEEYFDAGGLTFIEWGDRVVDFLPGQRFDIQLEITGPTARTFTVSSPAPTNQAVLEQLHTRLIDH